MAKRLLLCVLAATLALGCIFATSKRKLEKRYAEGLVRFDQSDLEKAGLGILWEQSLGGGVDGRRDRKNKVDVVGAYLYEDTILITTEQKVIYALDRKERRLEWVTIVPEPVRIAPTFFDRRYYAAGGRELIVVDSKGTTTVVGEFPTSIAVPVLVTDDYIYAVGADGTVHKLDKTRLLEVWPAPARTEGVILGTPVEVADLLVFGVSTGELIGVDKLGGGRRLDVMGLGQIMGGPVTDGKFIYFGSADFYAYCYTTLETEVWRQLVEGKVMTTPVLSGETLLVETLRAGLVALDKKDGHELWRNGGIGKFAATDGKVLFGVGADKELIFADATQNKTFSRVDISGFDIVPRNTFGDGLVYLVSKDGRVACLKAK